MNKPPIYKPMTRARWAETVRADLLAGGATIEVLPSGLTRIATQYDFITTTDLATLNQRDVLRILHRSF
jgi:hypothetical protein